MAMIKNAEWLMRIFYVISSEAVWELVFCTKHSAISTQHSAPKPHCPEEILQYRQAEEGRRVDSASISAKDQIRIPDHARSRCDYGD